MLLESRIQSLVDLADKLRASNKSLGEAQTVLLLSVVLAILVPNVYGYC
jgi:hypothetical protein